MKLNFAENIKRLRKEKEITQEKLADQLGVSAQSVSRWELGICYPDLEMLPSIANYFGVTVDFLLSNDTISKEKDYEIFCERLKEYRRNSEKGRECIGFVQEYCRKYPENDEYAFLLLRAICDHVCGDDKETAKYMDILLKNAERLLTTRWRYEVIQYMAAACEEKDLDRWLSMAPYATAFNRRNCLTVRYSLRGEYKNSYIQRGLEKIEAIAAQLEAVCADSFGPVKKAEFIRDQLRIIESFGADGCVPDGWKLFYARRQLVLAACLFASAREEEGWIEFDSAMETIKYVLSLKDEWLSIGGAFFAHLKVSRDWKLAMDEEGNQHKLFAVTRFSNCNLKGIYDLLTDPRWTWFEPIRGTEKYLSAVEWLNKAKEDIN